MKVVLVALVLALPASAASPMLPSVPGERYHGVRQGNLQATVCKTGWTSTVRPPESYTAALKRWLLRDQNLPGSVSDYQLDHMVSLELGGAPYLTRNLFMQPQAQAHRDDQLENDWHRKLCAGTLTLRQAQRAEVAYKRANG